MLSSNDNIILPLIVLLVLFSSSVSSLMIFPENLFYTNPSDITDGRTNVLPQNFPIEHATFGYTRVLDCQNNRVDALMLIQNMNLNQVALSSQYVYITPENVLRENQNQMDDNLIPRRCFALHDAIIDGLTYRNFITAELCSIQHFVTSVRREENENRLLRGVGPNYFLGVKDQEAVYTNYSTYFYIANIRMTDGNCHPAIAIGFP